MLIWIRCWKNAGWQNENRTDWQKTEIFSIVNELEENRLKYFLEIARAYKLILLVYEKNMNSI